MIAAVKARSLVGAVSREVIKEEQQEEGQLVRQEEGQLVEELMEEETKVIPLEMRGSLFVDFIL